MGLLDTAEAKLRGLLSYADEAAQKAPKKKK